MSVEVETSPSNVHEWIFFERALDATAAKEYRRCIAQGERRRRLHRRRDTAVSRTGHAKFSRRQEAKAWSHYRRDTITKRQQSRLVGRRSQDGISTNYNPQVENCNYSTSYEAPGAVNGGGPTRTTPEISTAVKLKVARKATSKMDRSRQFQACVAAAVRVNMSPDDLEVLMRNTRTAARQSIWTVTGYVQRSIVAMRRFEPG